MKFPGLFTVIFLITSGFGFLSPTPDMTYEFVIEKESQINILGSSNITEFTCCCEDEFTPQRFFYQRLANGSYQFSGAELRVNSDAIDCGGKMINQDMQKTLKADEHPFITIELLEGNVVYRDPTSERDVSKVQATAVMTIAQRSQSRLVTIDMTSIGEQRFRFEGSTTLLLSDFGLEAPRALLGLIKVDDRMIIDFDLIVQLTQPTGNVGQ